MHVDTPSRKAFEAVTAALEKIDRYKETLDVRMLESATEDLERALQEDPDYLSAVFHQGIVQDLIGKPADAVPFFERIRKELPDDDANRPIRDEVTFNLAVAHYHQYHHPELKKAEAYLLEVIDSEGDNQVQKNLARAVLAQTCAMLMIPSTPQHEKLQEEAGRAEVLQFVRANFEKLKYHRAAVREALEPRRTAGARDGEVETWETIRATIDNAEGMALMYSTDYLVEDEKQKVEDLGRALEMLEASQNRKPDDWANTCDLGSAHMRLGVALKKLGVDEEDFGKELEQAAALLTRVVEKLRPDYGFALYELGRVYRVWGKFDQALEYLARSYEIKQHRDVGDHKVEGEILLAQKKDDRFPWPA